MSSRGADAPERWAELPEDPTPPLLWRALLDGRYEASVTATGQRTGRLTVRDRQDRRLLVSRPVPLGPGSLYGPAPQEVRDWQQRTERAVAWQRHGETGR